MRFSARSGHETVTAGQHCSSSREPDAGSRSTALSVRPGVRCNARARPRRAQPRRAQGMRRRADEGHHQAADQDREVRVLRPGLLRQPGELRGPPDHAAHAATNHSCQITCPSRRESGTGIHAILDGGSGLPLAADSTAEESSSDGVGDHRRLSTSERIVPLPSGSTRRSIDPQGLFEGRRMPS